MSKTVIQADKLKLEALNVTGKLVYGLPQYIYIKSFSYDDNNVITVNYYELLKTSDTEFDLIAKLKYSIADGKAFTDEKGHLVYKEVDGVVQYEDSEIPTYDVDGEAIVDVDGNPVMETIQVPLKREDDYSRNFVAFATLIIPSIFADVSNHLGYHANEAGAIDNPVIV